MQDPPVHEETQGYALPANAARSPMRKESNSRNRKGREIYSIGSIGRENSLYRVWFCNDQPQCAVREIPIAHGSTLRKCVKTEKVDHQYRSGNLHVTEQERDVHRCKAWRNARELSYHCETNPFSDPIGLCCGVTGTLVCFLCLGLVPLRNETHILREMANRTQCREQQA